MTRCSPLHCHLALVHVIPPLHLVICEVYSLLVHLLARYYCNVVRVVLFDLMSRLESTPSLLFKFVFIIGPIDLMGRDQTKIESIRADAEEYCAVLCCVVL